MVNTTSTTTNFSWEYPDQDYDASSPGWDEILNQALQDIDTDLQSHLPRDGSRVMTGGIDWEADGGVQTVADMGVTSTPTAGTEQSLGIAIDGWTAIKAYAEADGAGGVQNQSIRPQHPLDLNGNVLKDGSRGYVEISNNDNLRLGADLVAADGETIWDESGTHIEQTSLENDSVTVAGNSVSLGGSTGISHGDLSTAPSSAHHSKYTDSEAVTAVNNETSLSVDISGDADTADGYDIQKNGTDGSGVINFKT